MHPSQLDELQDDVLNFKDSDRDSVLSYFVKQGKTEAERTGRAMLRCLVLGRCPNAQARRW